MNTKDYNEFRNNPTPEALMKLLYFSGDEDVSEETLVAKKEEVKKKLMDFIKSEEEKKNG